MSMKRRQFLSLVGSVAAAWPLHARAQQPARAVIGYLSVQAAAERPQYVDAFRKGLAEQGFVEGQNITIEYRAADNRPERLPELAADLVRRQIAAIATSGGPPAALAAKRATDSIPIVFASGGDPVQLGLVSSFSRPGGNLTGVYFLFTELTAKRLALLHELVPKAKRIALLVNPTNPAETEPTLRNATLASRELDLEVAAFNALTPAEIDSAFTAMKAWRAAPFSLAPTPFSAADSRTSHRSRHAMRCRPPTSFATLSRSAA
jgi:putative ABC transport system substrate-binding protein